MNKTPTIVKATPNYCPVCDSTKHKKIFDIPPREIVRCESCDHEYVNPVPKIYSEKPDCVFKPNEEESIGTKIESGYISRAFCRHGITDSRLLDLGGGRGRLIGGLIQYGFSPRNIFLQEYSQRNVTVVRRKYPNINIIMKDAEEDIPFGDNYFDVVLMVEFLEHIAHPREVMRNVERVLKEGGIAVIRGLPNNESLEAFIGGRDWKMRKSLHHYQFFNKDTLAAFLENFPGLEIVEMGCFLEIEDCRWRDFYNLERIANGIGIDLANTQEETAYRVAEKIRRCELTGYKHADRLPIRKNADIKSKGEIESLFSIVNVHFQTSPDLGVILRKKTKC